MLRDINIADLKDIGACDKTVHNRFAHQVRTMYEQDRDIFTGIYGLDRAKRSLVEVLMSGHGVILKGDFGVGKTHLASAVYSVLQDYYLNNRVYTNRGCPVRENSIHLYRYLFNKDNSALKHICPVCRHKYIVSDIEPQDILLDRVFLSEGFGFARIQGNEDIEPEKILGMYHLTRYAEIGDPFDPRVLEPGKIAHASAGVLFIDELGLLNKEAQYALIQGLQEKSFCPANSRMTFPIDLLFVATTNSINEFQIHRAIHNRLVGVRIDRVSLEEELKIVKDKLSLLDYEIGFPSLLLEFLVHTIRKLNNRVIYLGIRSSIRAAHIAASSAYLEGRDTATYCDIYEGIYSETIGQADDESYENTVEMLVEDKLNFCEYLIDKTGINEINSINDILNDKTANTQQELDRLFDDISEDIIVKLPEHERNRQTALLYFNSCVEAFKRLQ
ncbi:magnesium chelatase subunit ChlI [Candidatus Magnetoovum chiemensis]|nr:magnesium chelatase subunit ChlI [Candidatus Magnetoovum chiemensis]